MIEKELGEKLEDLLDKRNALAKTVNLPKAKLWTKEELADHSKGSKDEASDKDIAASVAKGNDIFMERIKKDFNERKFDVKGKEIIAKKDAQGKEIEVKAAKIVWELKDDLIKDSDNSKEGDVRKNKIIRLTEGMNYWAGSWTDETSNFAHFSPTRYTAIQYYA